MQKGLKRPVDVVHAACVKYVWKDLSGRGRIDIGFEALEVGYKDAPHLHRRARNMISRVSKYEAINVDYRAINNYGN